MLIFLCVTDIMLIFFNVLQYLPDQLYMPLNVELNTSPLFSLKIGLNTGRRIGPVVLTETRGPQFCTVYKKVLSTRNFVT